MPGGWGIYNPRAQQRSGTYISSAIGSKRRLRPKLTAPYLWLPLQPASLQELQLHLPHDALPFLFAAVVSVERLICLASPPVRKTTQTQVFLGSTASSASLKAS